MRSLLFIILLFSLSPARSQRVVDISKTADHPISGLYYTVGGEPVSRIKYVRVIEGSPFFNENWMLGSLIVAGGKRYDSIRLRLDLVENELQYLNGNDDPMVATTPVSEIWLKDSINNRRYHFLNATTISSSPSPEKGWYQLLTDGPTLVLKGAQKIVTEVTRYGTGVIDQIITTRSKYYILSGNQLFPFKKTSELPGLLKDKKEVLEKYIQSNSLGSKSEDAFITLVSYYNSIRTN